MTRNSYLTCLFVLLGCTGTRTGNPDGAPSYESGSRFMEEPSGGSTGHEPGPCWTAGVPPYREMGGDFAHLAGDDLVVAVEDRGLVVINVSDPSTPAIRGELAFRGRPLQLTLDADGNAATLALLETTSLDGPSVPSAPLPTAQVRLVRIDLADRSTPRRLFDVDVVEEFWQLEARGDRVFLLEQVVEDPPLTCYSGAQVLIGNESCPMPTGMRVTRYDVTADAFVEREAIEVSAAWNTAFVAGDAFFVVANYGGPDANVSQSLSWVDFASGALVEGGPVELPGRPQALARQGDALALLIEDRVDTSLSLQLLTLAGTAGALRGSLDLSGNLTAVAFDPRSFVVVDGALVVLVDVSDLDAPFIASTLPADVKRLVSTGVGSLGFGSADGGEGDQNLVVSLWDAGDPTNPVRRANVETDWFVHTESAPWTVDAGAGRLLLPLNRPPNGPDDAFELAVFSFDAQSLVLKSTQPSRVAEWHNIVRPLTDGTSVFAPSYQGLEVLPLDADPQEADPVSAFLRFRPEEAIDTLEVSGTAVYLRERAQDGVFEVAIEPAGGAATTIELDHRGDALGEADGAVVVLGLRGEAAECEAFADAGLGPDQIPELDPNPQDGIDPCASHRRRGVSVIALGDAPALAATLPITSAMDVEPIEGIRVRTSWPGYLWLPDGRLALLAERTQECESYATCEVLGVPAYESMGSPGCNPDTQDCSALPAVEIFVSGYKSTLAVYVLDGIAGDAPELVLGAVLDGRFAFDSEWSLDLGWQILPSDDVLALAREESIYDEHGNSVPNEQGDGLVRYFLDRVTLEKDGSLTALAPVNTPGRPVAIDAERVYSAEPGYDADGLITVELHRSALRDGGAYLEASLDLGGGFSDVRALGDHLFVLRGPPDWCAEDAHADLFAVALAREELAGGETLDLPGASWLFPYGPLLDAQGNLVLWGGPFSLDGRLTVDVADPLCPRIERYAGPIDPGDASRLVPPGG